MNTSINTPNTRTLIGKKNRNGGRLPKKVAVLYTDDNPDYFTTDEEYWTVEGAYEEALTFDKYFRRLGVEPVYIKANSHLTRELKKHKPDMAINLVSTVKGYDYLGATVPATLELLEIPYTGADMLGFTLGSNKYLTYALLSQHGIPVPRFQLMTSMTTPLDPSLRFPLILKLNEEHSNVEIKKASVVENEDELRHRLRYLRRTYGQDVLVSEFIDGREFAAFVFHAYNKKVYLVERKINLPEPVNGHQFLDYSIVWGDDAENYYKCVLYDKYQDPLLAELVKKAFKVTYMSDYGKFDIRMDRLGNYYLIDANANCHFAPFSFDESTSEISQAMGMYGIKFQTLLKRLLQNTMREWGY